MRFVDGEMQINLARHEPLVAYRGIKSTFYTNFVDKSWSVKTDFDALHMQHGIEAKFHVTLDHDRDFLSIQYEETGLRLVQRAGDRFWEQVVPYRAQEDRWWRIRHDGSDDTIWWEVSADGKAWKALAHRPRLFDLHKVRVELYAGTFAPVANPGVVGYLELQERRSGQDS